jgi:uncharacterized protein (TIGR02757 family)
MNRSSALKDQLEEIYTCYNRREYVHPDPLEFLYRYDCTGDREIAGLVASSLAYGRVNQILKSTGTVLDSLGSSPSAFLMNCELQSLQMILGNFKHRFTQGDQMAAFLHAVSTIQRDYGLLGTFFGILLEKQSYIEALNELTVEILFRMGEYGENSCHLLPKPSMGSACKRLHLFMRWMVRQDDVDPGGWNMIPASQLIVPVDVHMFRVGKCLGFTERKSADGKTAMEITDGFKTVCPDDPVRYDFSLTRFGIQNLTDCTLFQRLLSQS